MLKPVKHPQNRIVIIQAKDFITVERYPWLLACSKNVRSTVQPGITRHAYSNPNVTARTNGEWGKWGM
jgi:hypothetical protein